MAQSEAQARSRVFLSYARSDAEFAFWLRGSLEAQEIEVFRDIDDTLPSEEWWERLTDLIAKADSMVLLLSPQSARSKVCADEIAYARSLNKRIFPAVVENTPWSLVPEGLTKLHSVFLADRDAAQLSQLVSALLTDIPWVREHTRLLDLARHWQANGRPTSQLLREGDLVHA